MKHKQMKQKCRQSVEKAKSSVCYSSVLLVPVKACNTLSSFLEKTSNLMFYELVCVELSQVTYDAHI